MSNPSPPAKKRGRPNGKIRKVRQNISIDSDVLKLGRKLAFQEGMAFSTWINRMILERGAQ